MPKSIPAIKRLYFYKKTSDIKASSESGLYKDVYKLIDKDIPVLIHYTGDDNLKGLVKHGKQK